MEKIVDLGFDEAVKAISGTETVMYRHGVWNSYKEMSTEEAIEHIKKSGYGADIRKDEDGIYYVSIPCDADMW